MPTTEAGHAPSRAYVDQDGNYHLNGGTLYIDEAGTALADIGATTVAAGDTLTLTAASHAGKIILLDTAAGSVVTLPPATATGNIYRFRVSVTATSNSHIIKVTTTDVMKGFILNHDQDGTTAAMYSASGTDDTITLNRTTTGGVIGDWIDAIDILSGTWWINGVIQCVAGSNVADPLSATVS